MNNEPRNPLRTSEGESAKPEWAMIGSRLVSIRAARAQPEMADALGVSKTTYGRLERGQREVGADVLARLAQLGWSPLWVLTGIEPMRLAQGVSAHAAADQALVVARDDTDAARRRDRRIEEASHLYGSETASDKASQPLRRNDLTMALQLASEALGDKELPPAKHAELVTLIYELLEEGLPEAKVLRFARAAAA